VCVCVCVCVSVRVFLCLFAVACYEAGWHEASLICPFYLLLYAYRRFFTATFDAKSK
jgi:hypothetical protein